MENKLTTSTIYNLIILDESGSMSCVHKQTISGCNETINTIKAAQKKYAETQKHYLSIYAFQSNFSISRYIVKNITAADAEHITEADYSPSGTTNLNDAVGATLVDLRTTCQKKDNAIGSITIITDGEENASTQYSTSRVAQLIEELKALGWSFNFIGANIDVQSTATRYNIDNHMEFQQDEAGTAQMFELERKARMQYYDRVEVVNQSMNDVADDIDLGAAVFERAALLQQAAQGYFETDMRITPKKINKLRKNEIFVFGSNLQGQHKGGASYVAVKKFGAIMGQGVGLQGQSYAIPTTQGGVDTIRPYVDEFITFAKAHPKLKFFVTRIACGTAGFKDSEIAPLFEEALDVENIYLPQSFLDEL